MKAMLTKFPILAGCSTRVMEKVAVLLMGSTTIHPGFHISGIPQLCEQGDSIGQTQNI